MIFLRLLLKLRYYLIKKLSMLLNIANLFKREYFLNLENECETQLQKTKLNPFVNNSIFVCFLVLFCKDISKQNKNYRNKLKKMNSTDNYTFQY